MHGLFASSAFAMRLRSEAGEDSARIVRAFRLAFSRPPGDNELRDSLAFLNEQAARVEQRPRPEDRTDPASEALRAFCLVLLNANEFVTVD